MRAELGRVASGPIERKQINSFSIKIQIKIPVVCRPVQSTDLRIQILLRASSLVGYNNYKSLPSYWRSIHGLVKHNIKEKGYFCFFSPSCFQDTMAQNAKCGTEGQAKNIIACTILKN